MTLSEIIKKAIPDDPKDCRIKKAQKEALRLSIKMDIARLISENFIPKPEPGKANPLTEGATKSNVKRPVLINTMASLPPKPPTRK